MDTRLARSPQQPASASLLAVRDASGWTVISEDGPAWVTLEGYSQDKWLRAGERFIVPGHGLLLVEADRPHRLRLEPPPAGVLARLCARLFAGGRRAMRSVGEASVYSPERMKLRRSA